MIKIRNLHNITQRQFVKSHKHAYQAVAAYSIKFDADVPMEKIRNIGISAHIDSGKTTLTERILFYTGKITEMHEVRGKDGVGAVMDSMELERQRGITIQSAATYTMWKNHNINIIDTPGHVDFTVEVERALRVLDGAVLVLCSVGGVQSQTMTVNRQMERYSVPCLAFINKMDRLGAKPIKVFDQLRQKLGHNAALLHLPMGVESNCKGIVDLIEEKAVYFEGKHGEILRYDQIPVDMAAEAKERRHELIEHVTNGDDILGEMFLEDKVPTIDELKAGIRRACIARKVTPVFLGTALKNKGVQTLLNGVLEYLPHPGEITNKAIQLLPDGVENSLILSPERNAKKVFVGLAFKLEAAKYGQLTYVRVYQGKVKKGEQVYNSRTNKKVKISRLIQMHSNNMEEIESAAAGDICALFGVDCASGDTFTTKAKSNISMESMYVPDPVVSMSIAAKNRLDSDKFSKAVARFTREDPTFKIVWDDDSKQTLAYGMGELHLEVYAQRMEREFNVEVVLGKPKVAFREALSQPIDFDYLHKKQSGGAGQYAAVKGVLEPMDIDNLTELEFKDETVGTDVPKVYMGAIKKGFLKACNKGYLTGHKVVGCRFRMQGGSSHCVDSSDLAFTLAAEAAMRQAFQSGKWHVLEPFMSVEINVPNEYSDVVQGRMAKRLANIHNCEQYGDWTTLTYEASLNSMFGFVSDLRAMTQGKGEFAMEYSRYLPASEAVERELIDEHVAGLEKAHSRR